MQAKLNKGYPQKMAGSGKKTWIREDVTEKFRL